MKSFEQYVAEQNGDEEAMQHYMNKTVEAYEDAAENHKASALLSMLLGGGYGIAALAFTGSVSVPVLVVAGFVAMTFWINALHNENGALYTRLSMHEVPDDE